MTTFSLLHLSDFHFCVEPYRRNALSLWRNPRNVKAPEAHRRFNFLPESYDIDIAEAVIRFAYERLPTIDAIVVSGDIATTGMSVDLESAFRYLLSPAEATFLNSDRKPTLGFAESQLFLMPGNHDRFQNNKGHSNCATFDIVFGGYWNDVRPRVGRIIAEASDGTKLGVVGADFSLMNSKDAGSPKHLARMGQGKVYDTVVVDLLDATRDAREIDKCDHVLWAVHFPASPTVGYWLKLQDYEKLLQAAENANINMILSGHIHYPAILKEGGIEVLCAGSASSIDVDGRNHLHVIDIDVSPGAVRYDRYNYVWSEPDREFIEAA